MSKKNKVNPGQYTQAGRLSPDDAARELRKTQSLAPSESAGGRKATEPGTSSRESAREEEDGRDRLPPTRSGAAGADDAVDNDSPAER